MTGPRRYVRSWKEHWNPEAPLIFLKRLKLGVPGHEVVAMGDPVTPAIRKHLGNRRLHIWWDARFVGSRDYAIAVGLVDAPTTTVGATLPPNVKALKGNWYDVKLSSGIMRKVRGLEAALKVSQG